MWGLEGVIVKCKAPPQSCLFHLRKSVVTLFTYHFFKLLLKDSAQCRWRALFVPYLERGQVPILMSGNKLANFWSYSSRSTQMVTMVGHSHSCTTQCHWLVWFLLNPDISPVAFQALSYYHYMYNLKTLVTYIQEALTSYCFIIHVHHRPSK